MLSLIFSLLAACGAAYGLQLWKPGHPVWMGVVAVVAILLVNLLINLFLRPKLQAVFMGVQESLMADQEILRRKVNALASRGGMSPALQGKIEQEQAASIRRALELLSDADKYEKWSVFVRKQKDTFKAQFYFQLKDYAKTAECLKNALMMDPMLYAMQLVVLYRQNPRDWKKMERVFYKGTRRFKGDRGVILYAVYTWMLVQKEDIDAAVNYLVEAKTRSPHAVLQQNWEALVNGKTGRFSNAALGENWYAMGLEQPKMQRIQQPAYGGRRR